MARKINKIVIHCTATPINTKVKSILNYWRNELGWENPGYHILVDYLGGKHYLQPFENIANGVRGHNSDSIHISYIGGIDKNGDPKDTRNEKQKANILNAIKEVQFWMLKNGQKPKDAEILGHRDLGNKACPSFDAKSEYQWINS
jgi:N-acetylmuramoyl-L-alanine amidase